MKFLVALLFAATSVAVAQEALCTTAVGVSNANTACDEHIKDELTAFGKSNLQSHHKTKST